MHRALQYLTAGLTGLGIGLLAVMAPHPLAALAVVPILILVLGSPLWSLQGAFGSLWFVRVEPAPTDLLMVSGLALLFLRGKLTIRPTPLILLVGAYALLNAGQILVSGSSPLYALITVYLCLLTIGLSSLPSGTFDRMLPIYHLSALITAGLLLVLGGLFYAGKLPDTVIPWVTDSGRISGLFKDPNVAGPAVATTWIFVAERYLTGGRAGPLLLWLAMIPSMLMPLSRGALLFALVALAVLFLIHLPTSPRRTMGMSLMIVVLGSFLAVKLVPLFQEIGQARFLQVQTGYDTNRRGAWMGGIEASTRNPLGSGPGATKHVMIEFHPTSIAMNTHQTYLQVLTENGVHGLVLFLGILAVGLRSAWKWRHSGRGWVFAALLGLIVESFVVDTLHWRLLWILLALSTVAPPPSEQQGEREYANVDGDTADTRWRCKVGMASVGSASEQGI